MALGETGVFALTLPEPEGIGLGLADAAVVFEELGRALVPGPLVGTFLAAAHGLVPGAAEGRAQVGRADGGRPGPGPGGAPGVARRCCSRSPGGGVGAATPDDPSRRHRRRTAPGRSPLDPLTPLWQLDALPAGGALSDVDGQLWPRRRAAHRRAAGGPRGRTLDLAVAYAKERHQFGKPIGSFQAIKHMCADMLVRAEVARAAVHAAACLADAPDVLAAEAEGSGAPRPARSMRRAVAGAKLLADEAAMANARAAIQVHGGMGFTWEVPLHLHLKRSRVLATTFGSRPSSSCSGADPAAAA